MFRFRITILVLLFTFLTPQSVWADNRDPVGSIYAAAQIHGVSATRMLGVAFCESRFNPLARGDSRHSHGLFMLNDLPTGLLPHFISVGYENPYDAEEASDYVARVLAGDFLPSGPYPAPIHPYGIVSIERWSCAHANGRFGTGMVSYGSGESSGRSERGFSLSEFRPLASSLQ